MLGYYRQEVSSQHRVGLGSQVKELGAVCWGHLWGHEDRKAMDALNEGTGKGEIPHISSSPQSPGETLVLCDTSWVPGHLTGLGV